MIINLKETRTFYISSYFINVESEIESKGPFVNLASDMILFFNPLDGGFPSARS